MFYAVLIGWQVYKFVPVNHVIESFFHCTTMRETFNGIPDIIDKGKSIRNTQAFQPIKAHHHVLESAFTPVFGIEPKVLCQEILMAPCRHPFLAPVCAEIYAMVQTLAFDIRI